MKLTGLINNQITSISLTKRETLFLLVSAEYAKYQATKALCLNTNT